MTSCSVAALGTNDWPLVTRPNALMPGTSATATRAGPRPSCEEQAAVACGHPAGAEREVGAGLPGDVGDAVRVVDDRRARPPGRLLVRRADRLEVLGEVVAVDVGVGDVAAQRREPVVERELVERLARWWAARRSCPAGGCSGPDPWCSAVMRRCAPGRCGHERGEDEAGRDDECADAAKADVHVAPRVAARSVTDRTS